MSKNKWFYESLEKERIAYDEGNCTLFKVLIDSFKRWDDLLQENDAGLQRLSSGRRSIRRRARDILKAISKNLGPEVLLLCTSVTTIDKLAGLDPNGLIFALRNWWDATTHPRLLTEATNTICEAYPLVSRFRPSLAEESVGLAVVVDNENADPAGRAVAAFEHAIYLAAQYIPEMERQSWISTCFDPLHVLKQLTCAEGGATEGPKPGTAHIGVVQDAGHVETDARQTSNFGSEAQARKRSQAEEDSVRNEEVADKSLPKRARMTSQQIPSTGALSSPSGVEHTGNLILPGDGYCPLVFTTRQMISNLPEPFRTGIMTSDRWREELKQGGLEVTTCFSLYLPKVKDDVYVVLRVGYRWGWNICNTYGFGEELFTKTDPIPINT